VSLEFFVDIEYFRSHYGPGVDSASNRNEYHAHFLGVKAGRCVRLTTLPPSCAVVMKSGKLNFLEPSGPHQASNGTALPFYGHVSLGNINSTLILSVAHIGIRNGVLLQRNYVKCRHKIQIGRFQNVTTAVTLHFT